MRNKSLLLIISIIGLMFWSCQHEEFDFVDQQVKKDVAQDNLKELHYGYGATVGTVENYYLEPASGEGRWPHYILKLRANNTIYTCAINLFNRDGDAVRHRIIPFAFLPEENGIFSLPNGFTHLDSHSASGALDFIRHPGILSLIKDHPWETDNMIVNETEAPAIDELFEGAQKVYVFGEPFHTNGAGAHDIHQNQGNLPGTEFAYLNGTWQDGGIIIDYGIKSMRIPYLVWVGGFPFGHFETKWKTIYVPNRKIFMTRFIAEQDFTDDEGNGKIPIVNEYSTSYKIGGYTKTYGPITAEQLELQLTSAIGDIDIYVKKGSAPTTNNYDVKAKKFVRQYGNGQYYVMVKGKGLSPYYVTKWKLKVSRF